MAKKIKIGKEKVSGASVFLDMGTLVNKNGIIFGASGTGKTYTIRGLARGFASMDTGNRCIIFDVHGDILPNHPMVSSVKISEKSEMGLQPFIIDPDQDNGGVNRVIKRFIYSINSTTNKLGSKQESALRSLLTDLFKARGFNQEDARTWSLNYDPREYKSKYKKDFPTFEDLIRFTTRKQEELFVGANSEVVRKFIEFAKKSRILQKKVAREDFQTDEELTEARDKIVDIFSTFIYSESSGITEQIIQDQIKYSSSEVIGGVLNRLKALHFKGIFKNTKVKFDLSKPIQRYDLSSLETEDQKIFINMVLGDLFLELKARGFGGRTDTFVFIDEAKNYIDTSADNMVNKFFLEIRKFGCGVWLGAQNIKHFSDDIITNAGTKIILGVDTIHAKSFSQRLNLDISKVTGIIPKKTFLVEKKEDGEISRFIEVGI